MNENINLVEILKDVPKGTKLYSPLCGECEFCGLLSDNKVYTIQIKDSNNGNLFTLTSQGKYFNTQDEECMLFPSKNNRSWTNWKHKHFEPFQKVLVASDNSHTWEPDIYRFYDAKRHFHQCMYYYNIRKDDKIIPYEGNEEEVGKPHGIN